MSTKFYTLLTDIGAAKLASAAALGVPLKITHMAVGDGGGVLPTPDAKQTALVNEKRRAALNMLYIDPQNSSQIIAEQVIPENEGGWWIREVGLFDESGALIAVGNCPESYKPQLAEGSGRTQTVRMVLITSSTDNITLKIDPAVVLATRKYVDDKVLELKVYVDDLMAKHLAAPDPHSQYAQKESPTFTGTPKAPTPAAGNNTTQVATTAFVQAALTAIINGAPATLDTLKEIAVAINNDPKFSTTINNALALKAPLLSPALTGTPTAPTAAQSVNNTQIATTAFVKSAIAAMVGSAPAALDTLNELAAALGNDPNFATTMLNALAGKQPLDNTLTNLSGKDVAGLLAYLGLGEGSALPVGVPVPWPSATPPTGWLKCNGAAFSAEEYPELAKVYPTNKLPDLRGEFIRGWDDGRGVDAGRQLLSSQGDAIRNIEGFADGGIGMSFDAIRGAFYDAGTRSARMPNNTTQVATTAFVQAALTAIINGAPATLDTLKEIAVAINNDPKFSTTINNALALKAPLLSPALTGTPTAPTAAQSVNNTQIATTAFVKSAIAAMVGSAPAALDTLNELAAALGNDPNFATTMLNALAGKQPLDNTLTNLSGKDVAGLLAYLGLGEGSALPVGVPVPWPSATPPTGWLKCNGAAFSAEEYPELAKVYPTNKLPDLRGEFIRGWDDGRGVDAGRQLLSSQGDAIRNIEGFADGGIGMSFDAIRGAFYDAGTRSARMPNNTTDIGKTDDLGFDASRVVPTANENRPRNIAFNYIVRAA
ncbi:Gifsy-2 prophage tail fiber protein [Salmonella enterica subsp. enterica serovar Typhi]|nr:Gifsy-2 prophage tail fiber protein [Salmonella enterica subsp. enterica serovar Typhi]